MDDASTYSSLLRANMRSSEKHGIGASSHKLRGTGPANDPTNSTEVKHYEL